MVVERLNIESYIMASRWLVYVDLLGVEVHSVKY